MIKKFKYKDIDWIDLESPTQVDLEDISREYHIPDLVINEISNPILQPKVDLYDDFIFLILHFPIFKHRKGESLNQEVDFVVGKDFLITVHYDSIDPLHDISKIFEGESKDHREVKEKHAGFLLYYIVKYLYSSLEGDLNKINERLEYVEERIFHGEEHRMVIALSDINKKLLDFRRVLKPHREVLVSFQTAGREFFGDKFGYYISAMFGEYYKIWNILENNKETLSDLRDTNDSLLNTKTNDVMKFLTIMAFVTFPLSLLASVFGMNTQNTPLIGNEYDFWTIVGIMAFATLCFFIFFKYKKWL